MDGLWLGLTTDLILFRGFLYLCMITGIDKDADIVMLEINGLFDDFEY